MSENLCGPAAPTKGLVSHFEGNRPSQQGGIPKSNSDPAGASFRSLPFNRGGAAGGDAAFSAFTGGTPQMPATGPQAGIPGPQRNGPGSYSGPGPHGGIHVPPGVFGGVPVQPNYGGVPVHPAFAGPDGGPAPMSSGPYTPSNPFRPNTSDVSWVHDFLASGALDGPVRAAPNSPWVQSFQSMNLSDNHNLLTPDTPALVSQPAMVLNAFGFPEPNQNLMAPHQRRDYELFKQQKNLIRHAPDNAALPSPLVSKHYPEAMLSNLADNTEAALEAAFAHYDEDFQSAMDDFVEANPPEGRTAATREAFMSEMEWEQKWRRNKTNDDEFKEQTPRVAARRQKLRDLALEKAATETLSALCDIEDKSDSLKEKISNSTFADMVRRIAKGELIVQDNDLIDAHEQEKQDGQAELNEQDRTAEQKGKAPA